MFDDFVPQGFGSILDLVPLAESVIKLSAVCMNCFGEGSFTKRFGSETEVGSHYSCILLFFHVFYYYNFPDYCLETAAVL